MRNFSKSSQKLFLQLFKFFYFQIFFSFNSKPFLITKSNFNYFKFSIKTTQPNTSNARACMHKHVAKPYDEF